MKGGEKFVRKWRKSLNRRKRLKNRMCGGECLNVRKSDFSRKEDQNRYSLSLTTFSKRFPIQRSFKRLGNSSNNYDYLKSYLNRKMNALKRFFLIRKNISDVSYKMKELWHI